MSGLLSNDSIVIPVRRDDLGRASTKAYKHVESSSVQVSRKVQDTQLHLRYDKNCDSCLRRVIDQRA